MINGIELWNTPRSPEHSMIFQVPRDEDINRIAWLPQVYLEDDGTLIVGFNYDTYMSDAVQSDLQNLIYRSCDGGITWDRCDALPHGYVTAREIGGSTLRRARPTRNNSLLVAWYKGHENYPASKADELRARGLYVWDADSGNLPGCVSVSHRAWMRRSRDGGKTWEDRQIELPVPVAQLGGHLDNAIVLRDGVYLMFLGGRLDLEKEPKVGSSRVLCTEDGGDTWSIHTIASKIDFDFSETAITEAPNGDVIALIRTKDQRELWTSVSSDAGKTWSNPRDSGLRGSTPWIVTTADGLVVGIGSRRSEKYFPETGLWYGISYDNGRTWDVEHQRPVFSRGTERFDGNGTAVALPDGSVYVVYSYMQNKLIGGTRFHPLYKEKHSNVSGFHRSVELRDMPSNANLQSPENAGPTSGMRHVTIFRGAAGDQVGEHARICATKNGELTVAFDLLSPYSDGNRQPYLVSRDGGATWEPSENDLPGLICIKQGKLPYHTAELPDGTLLTCGLWLWADFPEERREEMETQGRYIYDAAQGNIPGAISVFYNIWNGRSKDKGKTWHIRPTELPPVVDWGEAWCWEPGILLKDGTFIQPVWGRWILPDEHHLFRSIALRTADGGKTWSVHTVAKSDDFHFADISISQASNGNLLAMVSPLEVDPPSLNLWLSVSSDSGSNWSEPVETGLRGIHPSMVAASDGTVVVTYIRHNPRAYTEGTGVFACASRDGGYTWDSKDEVILWESHGKPMWTYPSTALLPDGSVYVVLRGEDATTLEGIRFHPASGG